MNTFQIQFFAHKNGQRFAAVAPGRYVETLLFWEIQNIGSARIEFTTTSLAEAGYYERIESGYSPCSYETYKESRLLALASLLNFFADSAEFVTPSSRPFYVDRPNCHHMVNDLPF